MLMNHTARKNWTGRRCGLRSGFLLGGLAALLVALPSSLYAQSPLTVQPSTGRVGVGTIAPSEKLDVDGNVKATRFIGDGSQLTNLPIQNADVQVFTTPGANTWTKPANAKIVYLFAIGGGQGGGSGRRGATSSTRGGGRGGKAGYAGASWFIASSLGSTEAVTVGAGGAGGTAVSVDSTNGNGGAGGGATSFGSLFSVAGGSDDDRAEVVWVVTSMVAQPVVTAQRTGVTARRES